MRIIGIIPARYDSSRFPGKPLALIGDRPMIQWVYEGAKRSSLMDEVIVATDDDRIYNMVKSFGGEVIMTSSAVSSGTERIAGIAERLPCHIAVNIQGDEPLIEPSMIDDAIYPLLQDSNLQISTLKTPLNNQKDWKNPNIVKVVTDLNDFALYFSRHPIPYRKNSNEVNSTPSKHIGLYVFRRSFLLKYRKITPTPLEISEGLEQLRFLEHGYKIKVVESPKDTVGVDTPSDLSKVKRIMGLC